MTVEPIFLALVNLFQCLLCRCRSQWIRSFLMDLTGIDIRGANLENVTFDYATLDHADLRSIVAIKCNIYSCWDEQYLSRKC